MAEIKQRWAIGVEYDGAAYCGWQRQSHCQSVQQKLERALSFVADEAIELQCAGRTDAAVHALEQGAHFETLAERLADGRQLSLAEGYPHPVGAAGDAGISCSI